MAANFAKLPGAVEAGGLFAINKVRILSGLRVYCSDRSLPPNQRKTQ